MQTLTINVKDDFMNEVIKFIEIAKDNITIQKEGVPLGCKNLEYDPYFYERQKDLQKTRNDIKSGEAEMLTQEKYNQEMEQFFKKLEKQYAN